MKRKKNCTKETKKYRIQYSRGVTRMYFFFFLFLEFVSFTLHGKKHIAAGQQHLIVRSGCPFFTQSNENLSIERQRACAHTHTHRAHKTLFVLCSARERNTTLRWRTKCKEKVQSIEANETEKTNFEQSHTVLHSAHGSVRHRVRCSGSFVSFYAAIRPDNVLKCYENARHSLASWIRSWHFDAENASKREDEK